MLERNTSLCETINTSDENAKYDACVKELLANKQILARILKGCLKDFEDDTIEEIISYMDEPQISIVPVHLIDVKDTGNTDELDNAGSPYKVEAQNTSEEENSLAEGTVYFDVRFSVYHRKKKKKFLICIEAHKTTDPSKIGYYMLERYRYCMAQMISSQRNVEFFGMNYDDIKDVRLIGISMDGEEDEDSIEIIGFKNTLQFGAKKSVEVIDKLQLVDILLRKKSGGRKSENELIAMLEELFGDDSPEDKKRKLEEEYGLVMK